MKHAPHIALGSIALAALLACSPSASDGQHAATTTETASQTDNTPASAPPAPNTQTAAPTSFEGWQSTATTKLPETFPDTSLAAFTTSETPAPNFETNQLENTWTIAAIWSLASEDSLADIRHMQALHTATNQDPNLNFVTIHTIFHKGGKPGARLGGYLSVSQGIKDQGLADLPIYIDNNGDLAKTIGITTAPTYLLIGPDKRIHAHQGALHINDTDGIKPLIQGTHEARQKTQNAEPPVR